MSMGWIITIIVVALAIILSNIMLLKQTANQKMPSLKDLEKNKEGADNSTQNDSEADSNKSKAE